MIAATMETQEHKLIVFMLAQQFQRLMAFVKALESKGLFRAGRHHSL